MQRLSTCDCFVSLSRWDRETPQLELDALLAGIYITGNVGILNVGFIPINYTGFYHGIYASKAPKSFFWYTIWL